MDKKNTDYLPFYLGCKVQVRKKDRNKEWLTGRICEVTRKSNHGDWIKVWFEDVHTVLNAEWQELSSNAHTFFIGYDEIKLILRNLSDMAEEEIHELETAMWGNWEDPKLGDKESVLKMFINDSSHDRPGYEITVKATNWFRKNGFDVDGLLESGIAIDKKTLK